MSENKAVRSFIVLRVVACALVLSAGVLGAVGIMKVRKAPRESAAAEQEKNLSGIPVKYGKVELSVSGYGKVVPVRVISLSSEVKGRIVSEMIGLSAGVLVKRGQVLTEIDSSDYVAALRQAESDIRRLKSEKRITEQFIADTEKQLVLLERVRDLQIANFERIKSLLEKRASYQMEMEKAEIAMQEQVLKVVDTNTSLAKARLELNSVDAQLSRAESEEKIARYNTERCTIKSPIDGRIRKAAVDEGEYVNVGELLFELADDSSLEIAVSLDAGEVARGMGLKSLSSGGNWFAPVSGMKVLIEWLESPELSRRTGEVIRIEGWSAENETFTFVVKPCNDTEGKLFPLVDGMFCRVVFKGRTLEHAMLVPWVAVQLDGEVFVATRDGRLEERRVTVYCAEADNLVVTGGIEEGESLIVQKLPRGLVNGMKVNVVSPRGMMKPEGK